MTEFRFLTATLPVEVDVESIAEEAAQVAFARIAERLAEAGYPVTGDFAPDEIVQIDNAFSSFVGAMALNNEEIAKLNEEQEV